MLPLLYRLLKTWIWFAWINSNNVCIAYIIWFIYAAGQGWPFFVEKSDLGMTFQPVGGKLWVCSEEVSYLQVPWWVIIIMPTMSANYDKNARYVLKRWEIWRSFTLQSFNFFNLLQTKEFLSNAWKKGQKHQHHGLFLKSKPISRSHSSNACDCIFVTC